MRKKNNVNTNGLNWENAFQNETNARKARRELINKGVAVSLLAYDPSRDRYVFDSAKAWA